jgi:hypothetical protein
MIIAVCVPGTIANRDRWRNQLQKLSRVVTFVVSKSGSERLTCEFPKALVEVRSDKMKKLVSPNPIRPLVAST